jgi:alkylation response protein AidB-like acyl-CoA dehydrogenase
MLVASDATRDGGAPLQQLSGEALRTLSPRASRQLLSIALTESRRRPLGLRALSSALVLFLSVRVPTRHLVTTAPNYGIGVITRDGTSLATIEPPFARPRSTVSSARVFGSNDAEELLLRYVREWEQRGRPSEDDLEIRVSYDAHGESRVRTRWPRPLG